MTNYETLIQQLDKNFSFSFTQQQGGISSVISRMKTAHNDNGEQCPEEVLSELIEKHSSSYDEIFKLIKERVVIENRTLNKFETLEELNDFMEENECGDSWDKDGFWCVYSY